MIVVRTGQEERHRKVLGMTFHCPLPVDSWEQH